MDFAVGKTMEEPHNAMSSEMVELLKKHGVELQQQPNILALCFPLDITHFRAESLYTDAPTTIMLRVPEPYCRKMQTSIGCPGAVEQQRATRLCPQQSDFFHRNGDTALYSAVLKNNVEMATFLLDHGADINARNKYDK